MSIWCWLRFHDWEVTPTGWGRYTIKCKRCPVEYHNLEEGDW